MKVCIIIAIAVSLLFGADKIIVTKSIKSDTSSIVLKDTVQVVKYDTLKIFNTFRDTVKLIKSDSVKTTKLDTLKKVIKPVKKGK